MSLKPEVSVVIVNYNCWETLRHTLKSIEDNKGIEKETIVVDNNSTKNRLKEFQNEFPDVKFYQSTVNGGFAFACNIGAQNSTADQILFLNPDTVLKPTTLRDILSTVERRNIEGIYTTNVVNSCGKSLKSNGKFLRLHTMNGFFRTLSRPFVSCKESNCDDNIQEVDWVTGAVMFMSKSVYDEIKGWDEDYFLYHEDTDICKKAADRGYPSFLIKDITIEHQHGVASKGCVTTKAMAKTEVIISRHVYAQKHLSNSERIAAHFCMITHDLTKAVFMSMLAVLIPKKLNLNFLKLVKLLEYYLHAISNGTWQSSNTVSFDYKFISGEPNVPKVKQVRN